ncbi:MAG: hypothetical protein SGPRY_002236 [Prymnesium sp.]
MAACQAWPFEWSGASSPTRQQRALAIELARHWLAPFEARGISSDQLTASSATSRMAEERLCPIVQVLNNRIYIVALPGMRQMDMQLHRCDSGPIAGDTNENFCHEATKSGAGACRRQARNWERHRLHVVLRLLHHTTQRLKLPDFEFRLCADDTCHGVWEKPRQPRPLFTMAACVDAPTIPIVQWNAEAAGRDPDLATWDSVLQERVATGRTLAQQQGWECREDVAVFRGSANQLHTYNNEWSRTRRVRRVRTTHENFNSSGRWALVDQRLGSSHTLNVRLSRLRRGYAIFDEKNEPMQFKKRVAAVSSDVPTSMSLEEQASRFKYILHVEGHGGWADRLKHLMVLGAAVIKQESGVVEWFEPLLIPNSHYLSVKGDLSNLSAVLLDAVAHDKRSRAIALRAVERSAVVFSTNMLSTDHPLRGHRITDCAFESAPLRVAYRVGKGKILA